jgi:hypothetical protein
LSNTIEAKVSDPDGSNDRGQVVFTIDGMSPVTDTDGSDGWKAEIDIGEIPSEARFLCVVACDKEGHFPEPGLLEMSVLDLPITTDGPCEVTVKIIQYEAKNGWFNLEYQFCCGLGIPEPYQAKTGVTPDYIPVFGGHKNSVGFDKLDVCGVWRSNGKGEVTVILNFNGDFLGDKSNVMPSEAGFTKDVLLAMSRRLAQGKYSYCKTNPGLCMRRGRYLGNIDVTFGGSGDLTYSDYQLILDELRASLGVDFEFEIPTGYTIYVPGVGNQGPVIVAIPHVNVEETVYRYPAGWGVYQTEIDGGLTAGGKIKFGDEGGTFVPVYAEICVLGDLTLIVLYPPGSVDTCLSCEA